jgi:hypothetical protein
MQTRARKRSPSETLQFAPEVASRLHGPRDLLDELERQCGYIDHTKIEKFAQAVDRDAIKKECLKFAEQLGQPVPQGGLTSDFDKTEGIRFDNTSLYRNHPLLVSAIANTRKLLARKATFAEIPEIGVVTHPSFNAAVVRYKGSANSDSAGPDLSIAISCTAIIVHFHIFWLLTDICWSICWLSSVPQQSDSLQPVARVVRDYVTRAREGLTDGSGRVPELNSDVIADPMLRLSCSLGSWMAAIVGVTFVMLHEMGHVHLHSADYSLPKGVNICSFFRMAGDPHEREFEADAFAAEHLRLLPADEVHPDHKMSKEQFRVALLLGITGLFVAIDIFATQSQFAKWLRPASHPSPYQRCDKALEALDFAPAVRRQAQSTMRAFRELTA